MTTVLKKNLETSQLIHMAIEALILTGITYFLVSKTNTINNRISQLEHFVSEQNKIISVLQNDLRSYREELKFQHIMIENLKTPPKSLDDLFGTLTPKIEVIPDLPKPQPVIETKEEPVIKKEEESDPFDITLETELMSELKDFELKEKNE